MCGLYSARSSAPVFGYSAPLVLGAESLCPLAKVSSFRATALVELLGPVTVHVNHMAPLFIQRQPALGMCRVWKVVDSSSCFSAWNQRLLRCHEIQNWVLEFDLVICFFVFYGPDFGLRATTFGHFPAREIVGGLLFQGRTHHMAH